MMPDLLEIVSILAVPSGWRSLHIIQHSFLYHQEKASGRHDNGERQHGWQDRRTPALRSRTHEWSKVYSCATSRPADPLFHKLLLAHWHLRINLSVRFLRGRRGAKLAKTFSLRSLRRCNSSFSMNFPGFQANTQKRCIVGLVVSGRMVGGDVKPSLPLEFSQTKEYISLKFGVDTSRVIKKKQKKTQCIFCYTVLMCYVVLKSSLKNKKNIDLFDNLFK